MTESVTWKIGGEAGFGIMSAGILLARTFTRQGYYVFVTNEYPSLIRGGHNLITARISTRRIDAMNRDLNLLIALNKQTVELHKPELTAGSVIVYDPRDYDWGKDKGGIQGTFIPVPLTEITKSFGGEPVMRNTVALGATVSLLGADFEKLTTVLSDVFGRKGAAVVKLNEDVARAGYDHVREHAATLTNLHLPKVESTEKRLVINGSEALGVAAVRAGLKFAAIYPMTPINALISYLADHAKQLGVVYKQPEDEIAGINMAIGASVAGVRSMVATSGGGFALMTEGVSLSGMIETPLVLDIGMRVGPATGMPTWTEQGELEFVIHSGHGEFPKVVLAPGDAEEVFDLTVAAFNLADRYQIPVFILTDKYLNESHWTVSHATYAKEVKIDRGRLATGEDLKGVKDFKRYAVDAENGVSTRSIPGIKNGFFVANSYEHDEYGLVSEDTGNRKRMVDKRAAKFAAVSKEAFDPSVYGDADAKITFVNWGTTKGVILEAMHLLKERGITSRLVHFTWLHPFPAAKAAELLKGSERIIDVEQNSTAQLAGLVRKHTGIEITEKFLKYDGRPFFPEEIAERAS